MCLLQEYIRGKDFLLDSRKTLECSSPGCALPILPRGATASTRSSLGPAIAWGWDPGWKGGWRERVEVFVPFPWNEKKKLLPPPHSYLESVPLLNFDLLKHNKNFSLKGEHKYLYIWDDLAYNEIPLSSWNTIVFHSCEVVSGNYFLYPILTEYLVLTKFLLTKP